MRVWRMRSERRRWIGGEHDPRGLHALVQAGAPYGSKCYDEKVDVWSLGMTLAELRGAAGIARGESDDQMSGLPVFWHP